MPTSTVFRSALLLAAFTAALAAQSQIKAELASTVTETVTLPLNAVSPTSEIVPEFVEVTTVGLATVTVFNNDTVPVDATVTYTPETTRGGSIPANFTSQFLTDGPVNATLPRTSEIVTAGSESPGATVATTANLAASAANVTSSKNNAAAPVDQGFKTIVAGFLVALAV